MAKLLKPMSEVIAGERNVIKAESLVKIVKTMFFMYNICVNQQVIDHCFLHWLMTVRTQQINKTMSNLLLTRSDLLI